MACYQVLLVVLVVCSIVVHCYLRETRAWCTALGVLHINKCMRSRLPMAELSVQSRHWRAGRESASVEMLWCAGTLGSLAAEVLSIEFS
jgi:hypothetical protein